MAVSAPAAHRPTTAVLARAAGIVALATVAVSGVLIALAGAAADHGFLVPGLIRAWAGWVAGPLSGAGISTPLRVFFVELAVLTAAYAAVVALAPSIGLRWIAAAAVLLNLAFLLAPPLLSNDVFSYIDVARLFGRYHLDPYVFTPRTVRHDPVFVFVHWRRSVTDYGPLFTLGARPLGLLTVAQALWAFKAVAGLASLGCTALVGWIAHRRGNSAARAVAVFGLNPIVLVWTVAGAHNDLLMMLLVLGGTALLLAERPLTAGVTLVAAAAIKLSAGIAIPFLVAHRARGRLRLLAGLAIGAALVVAVASSAFPDHALGMFTQLRLQQGLTDMGSLPRGVAFAVGWPAVTPQEMRALHVGAAIVIAGLLVHVLRGGDPLPAAGWALLAVVATSGYLLPWYLAWPLAFAAASGSWRLVIATCAVGASYAIGHIPPG